MVNKEYCMSSYLAFRFIERDDMDFCEGMHHKNIRLKPDSEKTKITCAADIDRTLCMVFDKLKGKKLGIMLSGGMDSANLAAYMRGCNAYTFRFLGGEFQKEELVRAEKFAEYHGLHLHYVDIDFERINEPLEKLMQAKGSPVHSIEPQIYIAAMQAKADGVEHMLVGESADIVFGGMDQLLSRDWDFDAFVERYTYLNPAVALKKPVDMTYAYEPFRQGDKIDFLAFLNSLYAIESPGSYYNAFAVADMPFSDPYGDMVTAEPLDLSRIRNGESKYFIRELFKKNYPDVPVPNKLPMPRPVDAYFADWSGPVRPEFRSDIDMTTLTGNQKWQLYCLEKFLNMINA